MRLNYVRAGRVVGVHGIRGELKVLPLGQDPAFLTRVHTFYLDGQPLTVAGCRLHKDLALMRLAEPLRKTEYGQYLLKIAEDER